MIYFITGNANKFAEAKAILPHLEQLDIDLPEPQSIDSREIIEAKLAAAAAHSPGAFIVEDVSLAFDGLNGLPGPIIKWFLKTLDTRGLAELAQKLDSQRATAIATVGYRTEAGGTHFFTGTVHGTIVLPQTNEGFGWDPIFLPDGSEKTFAAMSKDEKNKISHRRLALQQLADFLAKR